MLEICGENSVWYAFILKAGEMQWLSGHIQKTGHDEALSDAHGPRIISDETHEEVSRSRY